MLSYEETVEWLYSQTPQFERIGAAAYKPGLTTVTNLAAAFGNPQQKYKVVHVAGTNGKGSTSHTIAAILQEAGYRTGLYTSPHLVDFRERMRVNGHMIPQKQVTDFVERYRALHTGLEPSFFELTTVMAFQWFAHEQVDVAVIEVGLGGRLDSTNIVNPELDVITNISKDHCAQLGNTLREIAREKAGIMRSGVTTICGEADETIRSYLAQEATLHRSPIIFAQNEYPGITFCNDTDSDTLKITGTPFGTLHYQLSAEYQKENARTVIAALEQLRLQGWRIDADAVKRGFRQVCTLTGLAGRWMKIDDRPLTICDTGHNIGGWQWLSRQLATLPRPLTIVLGFANDKDLSEILPLLPRDARYIATQAAIPRAKHADILTREMADAGLEAQPVTPVNEAYRLARRETLAKGAVFVGGSTYVVADLLKSL